MKIKVFVVFVALTWAFLSTQAATLYVRSTDGSDADSGATWALAKATLAGAFTAAAAGDTIYLSQVHAETQASSMSLTSPGTAAAPCKVLCGNDGAEPPTSLALTATIATTGNTQINLNGFAYLYGTEIKDGNGAGGASAVIYFGSLFTPLYWKLENSKLTLNHTSITGGFIHFGSISSNADDQRVELVNTTVSFGATGQGLKVYCPVLWTSTANAVVGTVPTTLFLTPASAPFGNVTVVGVDLSALGSGNSLVQAAVGFGRYIFQDCKLGDSVAAIAAGSVPAGQGGVQVTLINSDSINSNYRYHKQTYQGTTTQETTIVRTGGASDGTTPISRKMVTTANSKFFSPLESDPIVLWNEATSAITLKIAVVTDNVTLTDADIWLQLEYPGTSGFPQAVFTSDRAVNILATPVNQTTDSTSTWTTTGLATPVKQQINVTVTPTGKGLMRARVMVARPSTTLYYCPRAILQ